MPTMVAIAVRPRRHLGLPHQIRSVPVQMSAAGLLRTCIARADSTQVCRMVESGQVYLSVISYWEVVLKGSKVRRDHFTKAGGFSNRFIIRIRLPT
jgi:hypothetical protein